MSDKLKVLELFSGIGACSKALERLNIPHEIVDSVEIDKYAVKSFNAVHGTNFEPQDITKWDKDIKVDLIMHGSPCQDFSIAGLGKGGDKDSGTRSSLMYETLRIVEKLKPKYVIWENVKNLLSKKHRHNFDSYLAAMEELGYKNFYKVLNAKDYGIPQNRERVFTVSFIEKEREYEWPSPMPLERKLKDMLENTVDEKYYISSAMMDYFMGVNQKPSKFPRKERFLANINRKDQDRANSITTNPGQRPTDNFVIASRGRYNKSGDIEQHLEPRKDGLTNTLTSVQKDNYIVEDFYKNRSVREYKETAPTLRSGRIGLKVVAETPMNEPKVIGGVGEKKSNGGTQWYRQNRVYDGNVATSVTTTLNPYYAANYRIRKLTPKECWRLMGFDDSDFEKAEKVNSNTQLYKQAGNSIVVNVLEGILRNMNL